MSELSSLVDERLDGLPSFVRLVDVGNAAGAEGDVPLTAFGQTGIELDAVLLHLPFDIFPVVAMNDGKVGDEAGSRTRGLCGRRGHGFEDQNIKASLTQVPGSAAAEGASADDDYVGVLSVGRGCRFVHRK